LSSREERMQLGDVERGVPESGDFEGLRGGLALWMDVVVREERARL
jgi:hypothetical protein